MRETPLNCEQAKKLEVSAGEISLVVPECFVEARNHASSAQKAYEKGFFTSPSRSLR